MKDYITPAMLIILMIAVIVTAIQDNRSRQCEPEPRPVHETVQYVGGMR